MTDAELVGLGLSRHDLAPLYLCPLGGLIGSYAHAIVAHSDLNAWPKDAGKWVSSIGEAVGRLGWLAARVTLGAILGLVVALYFVGTLQPGVAALAKLTALSILIGYAAPKLWVAQEKVLIDQVISKVQASGDPTAPGHQVTQDAAPPAPPPA